jgi:hypothetical protein
MKENYGVDEPALRKLLKYFMQPKFTEAGGQSSSIPKRVNCFVSTARRREEMWRLHLRNVV